jgi:hypothetical protein
VDKALAEVAGATVLTVVVGTWPNGDWLAVVFILYSLQAGFMALDAKTMKTINVILGLIRVLFNFIFMMCIIHTSDELNFTCFALP